MGEFEDEFNFDVHVDFGHWNFIAAARSYIAASEHFLQPNIGTQ